jgi:hypothetical protein
MIQKYGTIRVLDREQSNREMYESAVLLADLIDKQGYLKRVVN